jgi:hypothetical protein
MNIPCRGKSHLFVGLVDKTKYKIENLSKNSKFNIFNFTSFSL